MRNIFFSLLLCTGIVNTVSGQAIPKLKVERQEVTYVFGMGELSNSSYTCELEEMGAIINTQLGSLVTFQAPINIVSTIKKLNYFKAVQLSTIKNGASASNFAALRQSKVDKVNQGTSNSLTTDYSGKGVIIGIVDIGFQTDNPNFYNADGTQYRVSRFWDQTDQGGAAPAGYSYGKECKDSLSIIQQIDTDGSHGTHVAGIAGGSGFTSQNLKHKGVAHESELVFVKILHTNDSLGKSALGDAVVANPTIIDAYNYIFEYAKAQGKPAVINLSWGSHTGPHDGTSLFDKAVEQLVLEPGHIIVGSNGNNGRDEMHFRHDFSNFDTIRTIPYDRSRGWRSTESVYVDIWGSPNIPFQLRVHFYDSFKNKLASSPMYNSASGTNVTSFLNNLNDTLKYTLEIQASYAGNSKPNMLFYSKHPNPKKYFVVLELVAQGGRLDAWNSGDAYRWGGGGFTHQMGPAKFATGFKKGNVNHTMGENGGTGKGTISVGAYINRSAWINFDGTLTDNSGDYDAGDIAGFSSEGPTVDGRMKPDISAPGQGIVSSINRHAFNPIPPQNRRNLMDSTNFNGSANYWSMFSGTSMSGPHVAGIVALMLQANPMLGSAEIRTILQETAAKDSFTGTASNNKWGAGKIDALLAVKEVENQLKLERLEQTKISIFPNPSNGQITIQSQKLLHSYQIYDLHGKQVLKGDFEAQSLTIDLSTLNNGIYTMVCAGDKTHQAIKISLVND